MTTAVAERDAAIDKVSDNNQAFVEAVVDRLKLFPAGQQFIVDEVWTDELKTIPTTDNRAMGGALVKARRLGLIKPTGQYLASTITRNHANPRQVWERI